MNLIVCSRCGTAHAVDRECLAPIRLPAAVETAPLTAGVVTGGRFRIQEVLHRSGMSTVYRAADQRNGGAPVALKEFSSLTLLAGEQDEALVWLTREASLLSTLDHPRLPKLVAAFSEHNRHYLVMPFIEGETLEELVKREGPQPEERVLRWAHDILLLLQYLHRLDPPVIHRDLKPANILLQRDGNLTLLDLGVARSIRRGEAGTAIGTPGYAPPEQYQGLADETSDLYALGATMHRLLTGYDPEHAEPFRQPPVKAVRSDVTTETASLVEDLLQLAPAARPSGTGSVVGAVEHAGRAVRIQAVFPAHRMYGQMLAALSIAAVTGMTLYMLLPDADVLGLPLPLVPALLCLLPLIDPRLQVAIEKRPELGEHRRRAGQMVVRAYLFVLLLHTSFAPWLAPLIAVILCGRFLLESYRETGSFERSYATTKLAP